jgi:hypothetical protein
MIHTLSCEWGEKSKRRRENVDAHSGFLAKMYRLMSRQIDISGTVEVSPFMEFDNALKYEICYFMILSIVYLSPCKSQPEDGFTKKPKHIAVLIFKLSLIYTLYNLFCVRLYNYTNIGKAVPLQAWGGPEGSRKLRFPDFLTTAHDGGKVVSLTHWPPLLQEIVLVLISVRG